MQMSEYLKVKNGGQPVPPYIAMVCFLVREGANWQTSSMFGIDVMTLCPPEMAPLVVSHTGNSQHFIMACTVHTSLVFVCVHAYKCINLV